MSSLNLAARAGRWSANNWKKAFFVWLLFAVVALDIGMAAGHKQIADSETASGEAARAQRMLEQAGFKAPATESVLVQGQRMTTKDPRFRAAVQAVVQRLNAPDMSQVTNVQSPIVNEGQIAADRHSVLVQFDIRGDADKAKDKIQSVLDAVAGVQRAHPNLRIEEFGEASAQHVLTETLDKDFKNAERLT